MARELASAGELLVHPGKPICNGLIAAMSAACEVFAFTPHALARQAAVSGEAAARRRELDVVQRKLTSVIDAIADGLRSPGLQQRLDEL